MKTAEGRYIGGVRDKSAPTGASMGDLAPARGATTFLAVATLLIGDYCDFKGERRDMTDTSSSVTNNRLQIQAELFRPSLRYPSHSYAEILSRTAERYPENEAVIFKDVNLTYRELDALVHAFANALFDLGIRKGDRICLLMTNRPEFIVSWFALARVGAIISPMNPSYKEREVAYQLSNSESVAIVAQHELLSLIERVQAQIPTLKHVIIVDAEHQTLPSYMHSFRQMARTYASTPPAYPTPSEEDLLTLPYSSGTTGLPKGVMLSHKNVVCNACQSVATAQIEALLLEHPAVADVAVIAKPDEEAGEVPKAYVVLRADYERQSADELMGWVNDKLATYKNVHKVEFIDAIPRNPSGKILRRILKEQERQKMG